MQHIPASGSGWTRYYQYDDEGNRLEATSAPGDDPEGPYTHTYSYDAHGSMTAMPHLSSMIWNHQDELQEVTVGTETVYFQYAGGMRSRKYTEKSGTTTEERIYLGAFEIYRKRVSGSLTLERESLHISDGTGRICIVETKTVGTGSPVVVWRYQLGNHLGSAATEVDESGEVISYEEYHPYGTSAYRAVDSSVDVSAKRYRYTGMERDEETGLSYHSSRYLAPWLGRWTASDPIGLGDGVNQYAYTKNSPTCLYDPNGSYASNPSESVVRGPTTIQVDSDGTSGLIGYGEAHISSPDTGVHGGTFNPGEPSMSQAEGRATASSDSPAAAVPVSANASRSTPTISVGVLGFHPPELPVSHNSHSTWGFALGSEPPRRSIAIGPFSTEEEARNAALGHVYWLSFDTGWEWSTALYEWDNSFYYLRPYTKMSKDDASGPPHVTIVDDIGASNFRYLIHSHLIQPGLAPKYISTGDEQARLDADAKDMTDAVMLVVMVEMNPPQLSPRPGFGKARFGPGVGVLWYKQAPPQPNYPTSPHRNIPRLEVHRKTAQPDVIRTNWIPDEASWWQWYVQDQISEWSLGWRGPWVSY